VYFDDDDEKSRCTRVKFKHGEFAGNLKKIYNVYFQESGSRRTAEKKFNRKIISINRHTDAKYNVKLYYVHRTIYGVSVLSRIQGSNNKCF